MNDIQIFNNEEFGAVRTTGTPEQPLFCLADVARVLGLKTSKLVQRLSDDVLSKYPISDSLGREQLQTLSMKTDCMMSSLTVANPKPNVSASG